MKTFLTTKITKTTKKNHFFLLSVLFVLSVVK